MTPAEKFEAWLGIYKMEDYAPEMVPGFTAMMEFLDFMPVPKWVLEMNDDERLGCIAYGLEQFMMDWKTIPWDEVPEGMRQYRDEDDCPIGAGKHPDFGWFVLGCGQGPFIIWTECSIERLLAEYRDFRPLGGVTNREQT